MSSEKRVLLVTGVPGVGKTTVAELLADRMRGAYINLSDLAENEGLITGFDEIRGTTIVDLEGMKKRLAQIIDAGSGAMIFDGHYATDVISREVDSLAFVLRRAPWNLREELAARGYPEEKVRENVEAELLDVCLVEAIEVLGAERVCEVDTTGKTPQEVVDEVMSTIRGSKPCRRGIVDWLGHPESRELLGGGAGCT
jgi:adenylate kinase